MKKTIRLTESELIGLVRRIIEEEGFDQLDDTPIEDEPSLEDDEIEDYGFDFEDEFDDDEFQSRMRIKEKMKRDRPSGLDLGDFTRWDNESDSEVEKGWTPIKPSDLPLDKYLRTKEKK